MIFNTDGNDCVGNHGTSIMRVITKRQRIKVLIITGGAVLLLGIFALISLLFDANYHDIYGYPKIENGRLDMEGYSIKNNQFGASLLGEWEFFYNQWIITDNLTDADPDCLLNLPEHWTGKQTATGQTMKKNAFVSYRLTLQNVQEGAELYVEFQYPAAFKVFANGVPISVLGDMSKTGSGGFVNSPRQYDSTPYLVTDGQAVELVIELSYNNYGGMNFIPWVYDWPAMRGANLKIIEFSSYIIPGIMLALTVFSFVMNVGNKKKWRSLTLPVFVLLAFVQLLTVPETYRWIASFFSFMSFPFVFNICLALFHILPAAFFVHLILQKIITLKKYETAAFGAVSGVLFILFYALWGTVYQVIPTILLTAAYCFIFYKLAAATVKKSPYALSHLLMLFPLLVITLLVPLDMLGILAYPLHPGFSWMLFLIAFVFTGLSYKIIRDNAKAALKTADLENEIGRIKHQALQAQIKPHFIFNALSSIRALYERDTKEGGEALSKFASHLRQNIDSGVNDVIPFPQEVKNIMNYVELENLRLDSKLTLLIDIEYADFEIPTLSLQPLVENAIKYAGTQNKPDGYIRLHAVASKGIITVEIVDNGAGFDVNDISETSQGIKNCRERFKYLLGADMEIISEIGKGTTVKITFKKERDV